jgi:hypothetical protein
MKKKLRKGGGRGIVRVIGSGRGKGELIGVRTSIRSTRRRRER